MENRSNHFLGYVPSPKQDVTGYGLRNLAVDEIEPQHSYSDDFRSIYGAAMALWMKETGYKQNGFTPRFERFVSCKQEREIWGSSISEMRKAALDGKVKSVPERTVLLTAIITMKEDAGAVGYFDEESESPIDLSNNAMMLYHKNMESKESGDFSKFNLKLVSRGLFNNTSDEGIAFFEKMVSPEGMDERLRGLAVETGRASEKIILGWGSRTRSSALKVDDHSLAQIDKEISRSRAATMAMARQQGIGM